MKNSQCQWLLNSMLISVIYSENLVKWVLVYLKGLLLGHPILTHTQTHTQTTYTIAHTQTHRHTDTYMITYTLTHSQIHSGTQTETHTHWYTASDVSIISLLSKVCAAKTSWPICLPVSLSFFLSWIIFISSTFKIFPLCCALPSRFSHV